MLCLFWYFSVPETHRREHQRHGSEHVWAPPSPQLCCLCGRASVRSDHSQHLSEGHD